MAEFERASAKNGRATWDGTLIGDVTDIQINDSVQIDEGATSSTAGQVDRTVGHHDASGSFTMEQKPTFSKGDKATLLLEYASGNAAFNGYAVITEIQKAIPIKEGTRMAWTVSWGQAVETASSSSV